MSADRCPGCGSRWTNRYAMPWRGWSECFRCGLAWFKPSPPSSPVDALRT